MKYHYHRKDKMAILKTSQLTRVTYESDSGETLEFLLDGSSSCEVKVCDQGKRLSVRLSPAELADLISTLSQHVSGRR